MDADLTIPRLASDTRRGVIACLLGPLPGLAATIPVLRQDLLTVGEGQVVLPSLMMLGFLVARGWLTWRTFAGLGTSRLAEVVRVSNARRDERLERRLGIDSMSWISMGAIVALLAVTATVLHPSLGHDAWAVALVGLLVVTAWFAMFTARLEPGLQRQCRRRHARRPRWRRRGSCRTPERAPRLARAPTDRLHFQSPFGAMRM